MLPLTNITAARPAGVLLAVAIAVALTAVSSCTPRGADRAATAELDGPAQELATVGFYNLENLFDVDDDPDNRGDEEWLPDAEKRWTPQRYQEKLARLAGVIAELGGEARPGGPALLGVCEVENARVLYDLIDQPPLANSGYEVVHFQSPDYRGIDCALLYRKDDYTVAAARPLRVDLGTRDDGSARTTRDVLEVRGALRGDSLHVFVNHWPSRRGGEARSRPGREAAARVVRAAVDEMRVADPDVDIAIVGDFNDDPVSPSIATTLRAGARRGEAGQTGLYNPMVSLYRRGEGSLGYRDSWNLFDQIIVSEGLARAGEDWSLRNARVFRDADLLQRSGRFRGYPLRTYVGDDYRAGYSDHLPVYAVLQRPVR